MVSLPFSTWGFGEITGTSDSSILWREREVFGGRSCIFKRRVWCAFTSIILQCCTQTAESRPFCPHRTITPSNSNSEAPVWRCPLLYSRRGFIYPKLCLTALVPAGVGRWSQIMCYNWTGHRKGTWLSNNIIWVRYSLWLKSFYVLSKGVFCFSPVI